MSFFNEPENVAGTGQILTDSQKREDKDVGGKVWVSSPSRFERHEQFNSRMLNAFSLPTTLLGILADTVVWLSGAALVTKLIFGVQHLITIGVIADTVAVVAFLTFLIPLIALLYYLSVKVPNLKQTLTFRAVLFIIGVGIGSL